MTDLSSDPLKRMREEQKRMADLVGGGPVKEMLDAQKRMADSLSGVPSALRSRRSSAML